MNHDIIGAAVTATIGILVAFANYLISKRVLLKAPEKYSMITVVRQVLQVGYLVLVYFAGSFFTDADPVYLLVGAVLGMTLPMLLFTKKLLEVNRSASSGGKGKEEQDNG